MQRVDLGVCEPELAQYLAGVFAEFRRNRARARVAAGKTERLSDERDAAELWMLDRPCHAQMANLRIFEHLIDRVDGPCGDAGLVQLFDPERARLLFHDRL